MTYISNTDDTIDSRDVIERIAELKAEWADGSATPMEGQHDPEDYALTEDDWALYLTAEDAAELVALMALAEDASKYASDWEYGEMLVSDDYFPTYARELAEETTTISNSWPHCHIDWEGAAQALQADYTQVDFDGETYWIR